VIGFFLCFSTIYSSIQWYKSESAIFPMAAIAITCLVLLLIVTLISFSVFIPIGEAGFIGYGFFLSMIVSFEFILLFFTIPLAIFLWLKNLISWLNKTDN